MGKGNVAIGQWMKNKERFADFYNAKVFGGRQVVLPGELEEADTKGAVLTESKGGKVITTERYRDVVMRWKRKVNLAILACENQEKVHYAMPVRSMLYDALSYTDQIKQLWDSHNRGKGEGLSEGEYLSRFRKGDKLLPTITLVWYYGTEVWDGSTDLYGMLQFGSLAEEELMKAYVQNYRIHLVSADNTEDIKCFHTDLQQIFGMLKCRNDRKKLLDYVNENASYFRHVDAETYHAVRELLHSEKMLKETVERENEKGDVNVCKALEDLYQEGINVGMERGIERGTVELCQEFGKSREETIVKVMEKCDMNRGEAESCVEKYWKAQ